MKKLIYKISVFILLAFLVDKPIGWGISNLADLRQFDNRIGLLLSGEIKKDIIILGSSKAVNGIAPSIIEAMHNKTAYNLGFSGTNIEFHKLIFTFLDSTSYPEKIILTLDGNNTLKENSNAIFKKDVLYPYIKFDNVLKEITIRSNKNYLASKLLWSYRENQNLFSALEFIKSGVAPPDETTGINEYGAILLDSTINHFNEEDIYPKISEYSHEGEDEKFIASLDYIINQCSYHNIDLILIQTPLLKNNITGFNERIVNFIDNRAKFLDFTNALSGDKYFFDNGHLNQRGAVEFSKILAKQI